MTFVGDVPVAPYTLSMAVYDAARGREMLRPLISKGTPLPASADIATAYSADYQSAVRLQLYEGEGAELDPAYVNPAAEVLIIPSEDMPPGARVHLTLTLTEDGALRAQVVDARTGSPLSCEVIRQTQRGKEPTVERLVRQRATLETQLRLLNAQIGSGFAVFISAKTEDGVHARVVHQFLAAHGIAAFFSDVSLPALSSSDYRKEIDKALDQAQNMVVVTSSVAHVLSPWVEAEWGLFINEMRSGRKTGNLITVLAGDLQPTDLPASLRYYQALCLSDGALDRLLQYIKP